MMMQRAVRDTKQEQLRDRLTKINEHSAERMKDSQVLRTSFSRRSDIMRRSFAKIEKDRVQA